MGYTKYKIGEHNYYLRNNWKYVVLINSESYHAPIDKYLNKWFCYYVYKYRKDWMVQDYVNSYDYETYEILPTLRECKSMGNFYLDK